MANMPANGRTQKAEFELSGGGDGSKTEPGDESGRGKQEVTNVVDEMELSLANMPANERVNMDECGASQTVPGDEDNNYNDAKASLVTKTSRVSVQIHESGKAQQEDDQIPPPPSQIQHQSMTLGSEKLYCYPSNSGKPFGQAGGELRYLAPLRGAGGTTLRNVELCSGLKKHAKVREQITPKTPQPIIPHPKSPKTLKTPPPTPKENTEAG